MNASCYCVLYTRDRNVLSKWFLAGNQDNHQNFDPSLLTNKLSCLPWFPDKNHMDKTFLSRVYSNYYRALEVAMIDRCNYTIFATKLKTSNKEKLRKQITIFYLEKYSSKLTLLALSWKK